MNLTDDELVNELKERFAQTTETMQSLKEANRAFIKLNERLRKSEELKSDFISNIRNEINNPLNAIMGLAEQIAWEIGKDSPLARVVEMLMEESQNLHFQINNIMNAADLESGEIFVSSATVDAGKLFLGITEKSSREINRRRINLSWVMNIDDDFTFVTDPAKLSLIFSNILDNAIKFNNEDEKIEINIGLTESKLIFSVRDFGIGINPDDQQKIFDRFMQLETGSMRSHRGHGLGLSIVKALTELLGGEIVVESSPGFGTKVTVTLPKLEESPDMDIFSDDGNLFIFDQISEKLETVN